MSRQMKGFFFRQQLDRSGGGREAATSWTMKGGVPGGHEVICDREKPPFVPPMRECRSIALRHSDVVVDIGAYCGTFMLIAARHPVRKVIACEPTASTFEILKRNAARLPNIELRRTAVVGDGRRSARFYVSPGIGVTNSLVAKRKAAAVEEVPAEQYEDVVRGATVVKIDVEGAEYEYDVAQDGIRALIIDFHPVAGLRWEAKAARMIARIEAAGFSPVVSPDFSNGWTRAGSWIREAEDPGGACTELMTGKRCLGCGAWLNGARSQRGLCPRCFELWAPGDRIRASAELADLDPRHQS